MSNTVAGDGDKKERKKKKKKKRSKETDDMKSTLIETGSKLKLKIKLQ